MGLAFNPRSLVSDDMRLTAGPSAGGDRPQPSRLDAIFIPTRRRPLHLYRLLLELQDTQTPIVLLPTALSDVPASLGCLRHPPMVVTASDPAFEQEMPVLPVTSDVAAMSAPAGWDLPRKRNYALWFARQHGLNKVLLLDDDIRGVSHRILHSGARALDHFTVAGPYVEDFPDLSVAGHASRQLGGTVHTFLSGSCLFVRVPAVRAFFPPIYNEDWLFLLPHVIAKAAANVGHVRQIAYDPFSSALARFQEFGDVIADGLYWLLYHGRLGERLDANTWRTILSLRRAHLGLLTACTRSVKQKVALDAALQVASGTSADQCTQFVVAWDQALQRTQECSRGVSTRGLTPI